jgi:hypothetical protein
MAKVELERVCKLHPIGNEGIGQANKRIPTGQGLFPIHHETTEAIMPRMRALDLPAPGLSAGMDYTLRGPSPFGRDMPNIALLPEHLTGGGIVKRGIQAQVLRVAPIRLGADNG